MVAAFPALGVLWARDTCQRYVTVPVHERDAGFIPQFYVIAVVDLTGLLVRGLDVEDTDIGERAREIREILPVMTLDSIESRGAGVVERFERVEQVGILVRLCQRDLHRVGIAARDQRGGTETLENQADRDNQMLSRSCDDAEPVGVQYARALGRELDEIVFRRLRGGVQTDLAGLVNHEIGAP